MAINQITTTATNTSMNFLSDAGCPSRAVSRTRSASSAGSVLASHNPQAGPSTREVTRKAHAPGQCRVPADANSSSPIATTKPEFCSRSFAIMEVSRLSGTMIALFSGKLAAGILFARCHCRAPLSGDLIDPRSLPGRQRSLNWRLGRAGVVGGAIGLHVRRLGCAGGRRVHRRRRANARNAHGRDPWLVAPDCDAAEAKAL